LIKEKSKRMREIERIVAKNIINTDTDREEREIYVTKKKETQAQTEKRERKKDERDIK
jgi:hypothetical protein